MSEELSIVFLVCLFTALVFFAAPHSTSVPFLPKTQDPRPIRMAIPSFTPTPSLNAGDPSLPPELKGGLSPRARKLVIGALTLLAGYLGFEARPVVAPEPECECPCPAGPAPAGVTATTGPAVGGGVTATTDSPSSQRPVQPSSSEPSRPQVPDFVIVDPTR